VAVRVVAVVDAESREEEDDEVGKEEEEEEEVDGGKYMGNAPWPSNPPTASKSYRKASAIAPSPPLPPPPRCWCWCCCCCCCCFFSFNFFSSSPSYSMWSKAESISKISRSSPNRSASDSSTPPPPGSPGKGMTASCSPCCCCCCKASSEGAVVACRFRLGPPPPLLLPPVPVPRAALDDRFAPILCSVVVLLPGVWHTRRLCVTRNHTTTYCCPLRRRSTPPGPSYAQTHHARTLPVNQRCHRCIMMKCLLCLPLLSFKVLVLRGL